MCNCHSTGALDSRRLSPQESDEDGIAFTARLGSDILPWRRDSYARINSEAEKKTFNGTQHDTGNIADDGHISKTSSFTMRPSQELTRSSEIHSPKITSLKSDQLNSQSNVFEVFSIADADCSGKSSTSSNISSDSSTSGRGTGSSSSSSSVECNGTSDGSQLHGNGDNSSSNTNGQHQYSSINMGFLDDENLTVYRL